LILKEKNLKRNIVFCLGIFVLALAWIVHASSETKDRAETPKKGTVQSPVVATPQPGGQSKSKPKSIGNIQETKVPPIEDRDQVSYVYGTRVGQNFKTMEFDVNLEWFLRGILDAQQDKGYLLSEGQMRRAMLAHQYVTRKRREEKAERTLEAGKAFLEKNKKKPGVKTLPSGMQYQILEKGAGPGPGAKSRVLVHYKARLLDGTEIGNTYTKMIPKDCHVHQEIKGWSEVLPLMKEGSHWRVFVPSELAYGKKGAVNIPPNSVLIYEMKLVKVVSTPLAPKAGGQPGLKPKQEGAPPKPQPENKDATKPKAETKSEKKKDEDTERKQAK
jgi:FKBP-type peptidyl-prolyl cis-trans isomerase FklB